MNILSIDFGLSKVGVAIATSKIAEPYLVIRYLDTSELVNKIKQITEKEKVEKIVVGISEGQMADKTKVFAESLKESVKIPVEFFDETLSTQDAERLSIEAGMKRNKRRKMEDALAAAVLLQNYLDVN